MIEIGGVVVDFGGGSGGVSDGVGVVVGVGLGVTDGVGVVVGVGTGVDPGGVVGASGTG